MEPSTIIPIATLLEAAGPYGFVAVTLWAYWRLSERKDKELKALHERIVELAERQTAALVKVETALTSLRRVIERIRA